MAEVQAEKKRLSFRQKFWRTVGSTLAMLIVVAAIAALAATLFLPVLKVSGDSMTPALQDQDVILLWKTGKLKAGDLVGFSWQNKLLLKRVIGLPGDVISIDETGAVTRNGDVLEEPYVVPENRYFVLGDHRATSIDSRSSVIGCVEKEQLVGRVVLKVWPLPMHTIRSYDLG